MKKLVAIMLLVVAYGNANACTCFRQYNYITKKEYKHTDKIFTGKVLAVRDTAIGDFFAFKEHIYTFEIISYFKGIRKQKTIEIRTGLGNGDCGYEFIVGQTYIVYANFPYSKRWKKDKSPNKLETNICTLTSPYSSNKIEELRKVGKETIIK